MGNLKQIGLACYQYASIMRWEDEFPMAQYYSSQNGLYLLLHTKKLDFNRLCPQKVQEKGEGFLWSINHYAYIGTGFNLKDAAKIPIAMEYPQMLSEYRNTINILFLDGSVQSFNFNKSYNLSCSDIINAYIQSNNISEKDAEKLIRNANMADEEFVYRQNHNN